MSRLYPTLEDLKVDEMQSAQHQFVHAVSNEQFAVENGRNNSGSLYPALTDYMGLNLSTIAGNSALATVGNGWRQNNQTVAPVSQNSLGVIRSEIKQGLRRAVLCKDGKGLIGLRVQSIDKGLFVSFVAENSPAAMAGMRFGDQILEINNQIVAGWTTDQALKFLKSAPANGITMVLRDRPFERTVTMNKDSAGYIGFVFRNGKITHLMKDSSAARNGLLIEHQLVEVNGQNVVGLKDKHIQQIIDASPTTVTVTVMPCFVYDHMIKTLSSSLLKKSMDHQIPDI